MDVAAFRVVFAAQAVSNLIVLLGVGRGPPCPAVPACPQCPACPGAPQNVVPAAEPSPYTGPCVLGSVVLVLICVGCCGVATRRHRSEAAVASGSQTFAHLSVPASGPVYIQPAAVNSGPSPLREAASAQPPHEESKKALADGEPWHGVGLRPLRPRRSPTVAP